MTNPNLTIIPTHPDFIDILGWLTPNWFHVELYSTQGNSVRFRAWTDVSLIDTFIEVLNAPMSQDEAAACSESLYYHMWMNANTWNDERLINAMRTDKTLRYYISKWQDKKAK